MNTEYVYPNLMNREPTDGWEKSGRSSFYTEAKEKSEKILATHFPNYFGDFDNQVRSEFPILLEISNMKK